MSDIVLSIRTKAAQFYPNTTVAEFNILTFTETSLTSNFCSSDASFSVFRKERAQTLNVVVLVASRTNRASSDVTINKTDDKECTWLEIVMNENPNLFIYNVYIPPNSTEEEYVKNSEAIGKWRTHILHSIFFAWICII